MKKCGELKKQNIEGRTKQIGKRKNIQKKVSAPLWIKNPMCSKSWVSVFDGEDGENIFEILEVIQEKTELRIS